MSRKKNKAKITPPTFKYNHVELEIFEAAVYRRDHEAATAMLIESFRRLRAGAEFAYLRSDEAARASYLARFCAAVCALLSDPQFSVSQDGYGLLAINVNLMSALFEASPLETADHMARMFVTNPGERDLTKLEFKDEEALARWLLFWGPNSSLDLAFDKLAEAAPELVVSLWASWLACVCVVTPLASRRREELLRLGTKFAHIAAPEVALPALSDAYMYCSYATTPDRHEVKRHINAMFANGMKRRAHYLPTPAELADRRAASLASTKKPKLLVPLEHFGSFHAMYRVYAPILEQLRERFRLYACMRPSQTDQGARALFEDLIPLPEGPVAFETVCESVRKLAPDAIFYPSLGMSTWWTVLSAVRLAPIQFMTLGHPATSMSEAMDYAIMEESTVSDPALFSERILAVPDGVQFAQRPDAEVLKAAQLAYKFRKQLRDDGVVRIAVPAMALKLSVPFLDMLRRVSDRPGAPRVEVHFFPSQRGIAYHQISKHLGRMVPGCVVRPIAAYGQYLLWLAECDFAAVTFPFGGTNSTVDTLLVGLPTLAVMGPQPHERFDGNMIRRAGFGMWVRETHEDYEKMVRVMVDSPDARATQEAELTAFDRDAYFYGPLKPPALGAWARAIWHAYRNHEAIVASGVKVINWEEFA